MQETTFVKLFGNSPFVKILDAFIDNIGTDYSKKEIQELAGISKAALFQHWAKLENLELIKITREFGNTKLYTLNRENKLVQDLLKFEMQLIEQSTPKIIAIAK